MWAECGISPRCGLMLTLATNLLMWVLAVTNDSLHREIEAELNALMKKFSGTKRPCPTPTAGWFMCARAHARTLTPFVGRGSQ